jgi:hypothetical protein
MHRTTRHGAYREANNGGWKQRAKTQKDTVGRSLHKYMRPHKACHCKLAHSLERSGVPAQRRCQGFAKEVKQEGCGEPRGNPPGPTRGPAGPPGLLQGPPETLRDQLSLCVLGGPCSNPCGPYGSPPSSLGSPRILSWNGRLLWRPWCLRNWVRETAKIKTATRSRNMFRIELPGCQHHHQNAQPNEPDTSGGVPGPELGPDIFMFLLRNLLLKMTRPR